MILLDITTTVIASAVIFLIITLLLVVILLTARHYLVPSGKVKININGGTKELEVETGSSLLSSSGWRSRHWPRAWPGCVLPAGSALCWWWVTCSWVLPGSVL